MMPGRVGQAWLPGSYFVPSARPQDFAFEFWRGAGQFTAGIVEVVAGAALVGGGGAAAGGGVAAAVPTGGASLLITAAGGSAVTAGWAAVGHGATGIVAGIATIGDSLSLSRGSESSGGVKLTAGGQKVLRDPSLRDMKDLTLAEAIKARGGGGQQIQQVSNELRNKPLGEVANMAAQGDKEAETAIKLVKQAAAKAQKYGGK